MVKLKEMRENSFAVIFTFVFYPSLYPNIKIKKEKTLGIKYLNQKNIIDSFP